MPGVTGGLWGGADAAVGLILMAHQVRFLLSVTWCTLGPAFRVRNEPSVIWPQSAGCQPVPPVAARSTGIIETLDRIQSPG
jgi:hypothetical protein